MEQDAIVRLSMPMRVILKLFLDGRHGAEWYGIRVMTETKIGYGTLQGILRRLEHAGWLTSRWESEKAARRLGRPARRYYRMTALGRKQAKERMGIQA